MSLILIIDTSSEKASIAIGKGGKTIYQLTNQEQKDHASWIHEAIASALAAVGETPANLEAVGVTSGPGS